MKDFLDLIPFLIAVGFSIAYFLERDKRLKAEADLRVVLKRRDLDGLGKKLDDTRSDYDNALRELGSSDREVPIDQDILDEFLVPGATYANDMPRREMQDTAQESVPPKFFKGIAQEDLRQGQACAIEVDPSTGTTRITAARVHTPFPGES